MQDNQVREAERSVLSLPVILGVVLIILAEAIAVAIIVRRHELRLTHKMYIYLLPLFVAMPLLQCVRFGISLRGASLLAQTGQRDLFRRVVVMINVVYAAIIMIMVMLVPASHQ